MLYVMLLGKAYYTNIDTKFIHYYFEHMTHKFTQRVKTIVSRKRAFHLHTTMTPQIEVCHHT